MSVMNEEEIIAKILAGDSESYRLLVDRYQAGLIIHCENIMKHRQDGEDIAQDAFVKAYKNLSHFSSEKGHFSTWLYRIATNLCVDTLRRNKRKVPMKNIEEELEAIEEAYKDTELIEKVRDAVLTLEPPKYAAIIQSYYWKGKSYQEIATEYNTSTNTIGTWVRRAKLQLKGKLS